MSVQNLRKTYLKKGQLSVSRDAQDKPYVELAECLRVFPEFKLQPGQDAPVSDNPVVVGFQQLQQQYDTLTTEVRTLRDRLHAEGEQRRSAEAREEWLRNHVDKLTEENLKLLSAPPQAPEPSAKKSGWFARMFGK